MKGTRSDKRLVVRGGREVSSACDVSGLWFVVLHVKRFMFSSAIFISLLHFYTFSYNLVSSPVSLQGMMKVADLCIICIVLYFIVLTIYRSKFKTNTFVVL